jgi:hypothetical protein
MADDNAAAPTDAPAVTAPRVAPESLVAACDARDCRYNRDSACGAGAVTIAVLRGAAVCGTYTPRQK